MDSNIYRVYIYITTLFKILNDVTSREKRINFNYKILIKLASAYPPAEGVYVTSGQETESSSTKGNESSLTVTAMRFHHEASKI